jgi:hypothetical protein
VEHGDRSEDGEDSVFICGIEESAPDLEQVAARPDAVDVGEVADVAAHLRRQVGSGHQDARFRTRGSGDLIRDEEFEAIDDVADSGVCWAAR